MDLSPLNLVSFLLIFFIGLPHGSFDGAIASLIGFKTKLQFLRFIFFYLILFLLVIIFWINFPIISLFIFLLMTIVHFGLCDWAFFRIKNNKFIITLTYGMTVIFGIIFFNEQESFKIFEYLTNEDIYFFQKFLIYPYIITIGLVLYFMYLSFYNTNLRKGIIEICLLLTIFYFFDPLLSFAIYFCFVHTYKHLNHLIKMIFTHLENKKFVIYTTILFTIISWIAGLYIIYFLSINFSIYESFIKVIFIGLAALTLPHMILVDLVYRKKFNNYLN